MIINKITPLVDYKVKRLEQSLFEPTKQDLIKLSKVLKPANKKMLLLNFWYHHTLQSNVPSLPDLEVTEWNSVNFSLNWFVIRQISENLYQLSFTHLYIISLISSS